MIQAPVQIISATEPWSYAELPDGTVIKAKLVFMKIDQVFTDDGKPVINDDRSKQYGVGTQVVTIVISPEDAKKLKIQRN